MVREFIIDHSTRNLEVFNFFPDCGLNMDKYSRAWVFALETMATIGYGAEDVFFDDCALPVLTLTIQVCFTLIADALAIGVVYCRMSSPLSRAATVIFSQKAVIRRIRGRLYFMFQLSELRKHQVQPWMLLFRRLCHIPTKIVYL